MLRFSAGTVRLVLLLAALAPILYLRGDSENVKQIQDAITQRQHYDIEMRKLDLEEKRIYLSTLQGSRITEAKAREASEWILRNLHDYPQGKKARHTEEDLRLLTETIAALQKAN